MMPKTEDDFGFVSFDDLAQDSDEFGFVPFEPIKQQAQKPTPEFTDEFENEERPISDLGINEQEEQSKESTPIKDIIQETLQGTGGQIALGLTQAATAPLDLVKMYLIGEGLSGLEEQQEASEREGIPFDMESAKQKFLSAMESFPTQSLAEEYLEKETGISTKPKDRFSKVLRGLAEFAGMTPKGVKTPKLQPKSLDAEGKALRETADKFGLRKFAGMESEKPPPITPIVSEKKQAKLSSELGESTKKAIDNIIDQKIPVKKMRDMGINLDEAYDVAYSTARQTASKMGNEHIDFSNVLKWADQEIKKTKASSPSLSDSQKAYINILRKEKSSLTEKITPPKTPTLYGPSGEVITTQAKPKIIQKPMTAEQSLNQIKNFNSNVKGIYRKAEHSGVEDAVKSAYAGLNEQFIKSIDHANPSLGKEITFANKIFHEGSKLQQVEGILNKSFSDGYNPKKLSRTLEGKRNRSFLERSLGKGSIQDLERIAKYGQEAEKKVFDQLKNPKTMKDYLEKMTPMELGLLVGYKSHVGIPIHLTKGALHRIQGHLFTRNSTKKDFIGFLKEASKMGSSPAPLFYAAKKLEKAIKDEFGSEEDLMDLLEGSED